MEKRKLPNSSGQKPKKTRSTKSIKSKHTKRVDATFESLMRIFTLPEGEDTTLGRIEREISTNLNGFLQDSIVADGISMAELKKDFLSSQLDEDPVFVSEQADFLLQNVVSHSVHVSSPSFVGHMTSAIPYFMLPLAKIMFALNQNLVKIETSKAFTPLERQVLGMLHRLVYNFDEPFYQGLIQNPEFNLGAFCSGGTIANLTALWVALNKLFPATSTDGFGGLGDEGLVQAIARSPYKNLAILVSERGHYSLAKAANILGIGRNNLIAIACDEHNHVRVDLLEDQVKKLKQSATGIAAIVGIAGTTETGSVDPLDALADICATYNIHFHVDAAWGGPTLFSETNRHLVRGISRADSVTLDAHKQLYVPMGAGMVLFKNAKDMSIVEHSANYVIRRGSMDLGRKTLEGSRPGMAMLVHSGLRIVGKKGYGLLMDIGIKKAKWFAQYIKEQPDFELISEPELNILTYRYLPPSLRQQLEEATKVERQTHNARLNHLTVRIQKDQREAGKTFVSRTTLNPIKYDRTPITVFRVVLANPLTTTEILQEVIAEQRQWGETILASKEFQSLNPLVYVDLLD